MVRHLFQVIYPSPACLPMAGEFVQVVSESSRRGLPRRAPLSVPSMAMAAAVA
jgi:hypothetical protein